MTTEDARLYTHLVRKLLYLPSITEIRTAVRTVEGLQPDLLREAFDTVGKSLLDERRGDEYDLLAYVCEALREYLEPAAGASPSAVIDSAEALVQAAFQQPKVLRMRALLMQHRDLLSEQVLATLQGEAADMRCSPLDQEHWMILACTAALVAGNPTWLVRAYLLWGAHVRRRGQLRKAERWLARAIRIAEELGEPSLQVMALGGQVGLYRAMRDLPKALEGLDKILQVATAKEDRLMVVSTCMGIAQCCRDLGQYPKALDHLNTMLSILDRLELELHDQKLMALQLRGLVHENLGRYDQGFQDYQSAFELAQAMGDRSNQFIAMSNMAASFLKRGLARESYRRYMDIMRTVTRWGNPAMIASTHNNLGQVLLALDRPAEALTAFQKALQLKSNSGDKRGEAIALLGMGDALHRLGKQRDAETFYTLASIPGLETGNAGIIGMYADRLVRKEDETGEDVIRTLEWALDLLRSDRNRFQELSLMERLCKLYVKRGEREKALKLYRSTLPDGVDYAPSAPEFLIARISYARLLAEQPEGRQQAYDLLVEALDAIKRELREVVYDERRAEIIGDAIRLYGALLNLSLDGQDTSFLPVDMSPAHFAFDLHESAKSRSFLSGLADTPIEPPASVPRGLVVRESDLLRLERSYQQSEEVKSEVYRAERLHELRADLQACWRDMKPFAPQYVRFRSGEPYTYDELRALLADQYGESVAFVSFFCDESSTTAFVMRPDQKEPSVFRSRVGRVDVEQATKRLRRAFNGSPHEFPPYPPIVRDRPFQRTLDFLDRLSAPLLQFLPAVGDAELLCIAPHGPLHLLPFHALRMADGAYLASRFGVVYWPSLSTAVQVLANTASVAKHMPSVFVAGVSAAEDVHPEFFEQDAEIFDRRLCAVTSKIGVRDAARAEILDALPQHDVIHLSCHGFFDETNALNSGLLLSDGRRKPPRDPLSLSIMERRNFLITARDLLRTRLQARLVTLNACSTGLQSQRNAGDELEGFNRALLLSGTSSVMLTLWNVDQDSSRQFLMTFYRNWLSGVRPMEKWRALQLAQREFLAAEGSFLQHPYHWAPFTLAGERR